MSSTSTRQITFPIRGMRHPGCTENIQIALSGVEGVVSARVNYATERAAVICNPSRTRAAMLVDAVRAAGYDVPLERAAFSLRALGRLCIAREDITDARFDWSSRRVEIEWLAGVVGADCRLPYGFVIGLMARSMIERLGQSS